MEWLTLTAKQTVFRLSPYLCQWLTMSPTRSSRSLASSLSRPPPARPVAPAAGAQLQLQGFPCRTPDSARLQSSRAHVDASVVVPHTADRAHVLRFEPDSLRLTT